MVKKKSNNKPSPAKKEASVRKLETKAVEETKIDIKQKVSEGWIYVNSMIEVLAVNKDATEQALKTHLTKIESENGILVTKKTFSTVEKVENPTKDIKQAFSQFCEIQFLVRNYSMLIYYVFTFGPSAIEILEPKSITLGQGEAQDIANALASLIHQFASSGAGGMVISRK